MAIQNDTRGWILTCISALACFLGAGIICIDLLVRLFPGKKNFKIQDSNGFLSCSLSLSAGVMLFSALYKMLPSSKKSLQDGGFSPKAAAWVLIACFLGGVFGIQILSRIVHRFMPSHVVDCDHTHEDEESQHHSHSHRHDDHGLKSKSHSHNHSSLQERSAEQKPMVDGHTERTPLLARSATYDATNSRQDTAREISDAYKASPAELSAWVRPSGRPSLQSRTLSTMSKLVSRSKISCDADGPCHGYSDPCGHECFKIINLRGGTRISSWAPSRVPPQLRHTASTISTDRPRMGSIDETAELDHALTLASQPTSSTRPSRSSSSASSTAAAQADPPPPDSHQHHHHVPQNAFLSLSLQTSIAIALHKLPEGFITYATNHANPRLGTTVFLALAIHNISEGFALALPLYLATSSRLKALAYSFALGGLSQPLGAGVAAAWLKFAERGRGDYAPGEGVYGGMFAATAGVMASVALSLLQESLELSHNKGLCMVFAFVGMGVLGISSALTA